MLLFSLFLLSYFSLSVLFSHLWRLSCTCVSFLEMVLLCVDPVVLQQSTLPSTGSDSCTWSLRNRLDIQLNPSKIILQLGVTCPRMSLVANTPYHSAVAKQEGNSENTIKYMCLMILCKYVVVDGASKTCMYSNKNQKSAHHQYLEHISIRELEPGATLEWSKPEKPTKLAKPATRKTKKKHWIRNLKWHQSAKAKKAQRKREGTIQKKHKKNSPFHRQGAYQSKLQLQWTGKISDCICQVKESNYSQQLGSQRVDGRFVLEGQSS